MGERALPKPIASSARTFSRPTITVSPAAAEKLRAAARVRVNVVPPEVAEQLHGSLKVPTLIGSEIAAALEGIRNMPGLSDLAAASRALEGARVLVPSVPGAKIRGITLIPRAASRDDVAAVTKAVTALHDAVLEQSKFLLNQSIRQDRMDRRVFWMQLAIGVVSLVLTCAAIVVAILLS